MTVSDRAALWPPVLPVEVSLWKPYIWELIERNPAKFSIRKGISPAPGRDPKVDESLSVGLIKGSEKSPVGAICPKSSHPHFFSVQPSILKKPFGARSLYILPSQLGLAPGCHRAHMSDPATGLRDGGQSPDFAST